jgi:hypothetical protein
VQLMHVPTIGKVSLTEAATRFIIPSSLYFNARQCGAGIKCSSPAPIQPAGACSRLDPRPTYSTRSNWSVRNGPIGRLTASPCHLSRAARTGRFTVD